MEFVIDLSEGEYEVRLVGAHPELTLGAVTAPIAEGGIALDDAPADPERALAASGLRVGSVLTLGTPSPGDLRADREDGTPASGRVPFNRPPRAEFPVALPPVPAPSERQAPRGRVRFGWTALIVPIVLGLVMAVVIHPRMAMFAIFSPAMFLANWYEERRRTKDGVRRNAEELRGEMAEFHTRLVATIAAETRMRTRAHPDLDELCRRVGAPDPRLWERRIHHDDAMRLAVGTGCLRWTPEVTAGYDGPASEARALLESLGELHDVPVDVSLRPGAVVGVAGHPGRVRELARGLVLQSAVLHGPSDVEVSIVTDRPDQWDWAKWLPHVLVDPQTGRRRLAGTPAEVAGVAAGFAMDADPTDLGRPEVARPFELMVIDLVDLSTPANAPVREAIERAAAGGGAALTLAASVTALASRCEVIIEVADDGATTMREPAHGRFTANIAAWRLSLGSGRRVARRLAGIADPDLRAAGADLPSGVRLVDLLGMTVPAPATVLARWTRTRGSDPAVPIGLADDGPLMISLTADGPHALLAGTTGAGKSELLRSLVASLAATSSPDDLTFVLVDYKGGSAFDVCARLPHTVGMVTDLDGHLAQRALTCLEAELRYREERLREVGASDIDGYRSSRADTPMPRLFVVVDEFAALAKELPEFMASLIDVAQRGRSLGVHLLLATQRPQGVINDQIRANTNLRIALRVQDQADSVDVIGDRSAAHIGRAQPGRGFVRRGPGEIVAFQTALVTGPATGPADPELVPFVFGAHQRVAAGIEPHPDAPTDLDQLVTAVQAAFEQAGVANPRRPWPEPLPAVVDRAELTSSGRRVTALLGLADEPARQRRQTVSWSPDDGNLLLYGVAGSGTTTALGSLAASLADTSSPDELHLYALDFDDQLLAPLAGLDHVGGVVGSADRERQVRLLRMLQREIAQRRTVMADNPAALADLPRIVVLMDNYAGFAAAFDEPSDLGIKASFARIVGDGPGVGIVSVVTAKQPVDLPAQIASLVPTKLLFRLTDRYEYAGLGVAGAEPPTTPGRCYESLTGREVQIAMAHPGGLANAVEAVEPALMVGRGPAPVGVLPLEVKIPDIVAAGQVFELQWHLPVGIGDTDLSPVGFTLGEGDHVVISGPARSGKSTALTTLARVAKAARPELVVIGVAPRRSPLRECPEVDLVFETAERLAEAVERHGHALVLVDDATMVDDADGVLAGLADRSRPGVHVAAAASGELLRSAYGHWTISLRRSRIGLALRPNPASDGDLWQTSLPRRGPAQFSPGRGYLVADGAAELVQVAWQ